MCVTQRFQRGSCSCWPPQRAAEELEVGVDERFRQHFGATRCTSCQRRYVFRSSSGSTPMSWSRALMILGPPTLSRSKLRGARGREIRRPVRNAGRQRLQLGASSCDRLRRIAARVTASSDASASAFRSASRLVGGAGDRPVSAPAVPTRPSIFCDVRLIFLLQLERRGIGLRSSSRDRAGRGRPDRRRR